MSHWRIGCCALDAEGAEAKRKRQVDHARFDSLVRPRLSRICRQVPDRVRTCTRYAFSADLECRD